MLAVLNYQQFEWAVNDGEISFSDVTDAFDAFFGESILSDCRPSQDGDANVIRQLARTL